MNSLTPGPVSSTTPDKSEPSVSGGGGLTLLLPSRMSASHGPTPEAATMIRSSPAAGAGRGTSSTTTTSGAPKRWIRAAFMFVPPFSQGSTLEFQEVAVIRTLWRPAFSRDAISPHERYQTSVPEWDRQFGLARVHHEHREELSRRRLAGIGADAVAVAGQLGEALSGVVGRHRSVVDLTADRPLKHGRVDESGFGMRVARRVAARTVFDKHDLDAFAGNVRQLVLVDESYLGVLRLQRIREDAAERQDDDKQRTEDAFHGAPILRLAECGIRLLPLSGGSPGWNRPTLRLLVGCCACAARGTAATDQHGELASRHIGSQAQRTALRPLKQVLC